MSTQNAGFGADTTQEAGLVADSITKAYPTRAGELRILQGVSLTLLPGQSAAITGPSGSGKSTLLNILGTLEPPTTGRLRIHGQDPFTLPPRELAQFRNCRIGFVFQEHHLLPQCSALENVLLPTLAGHVEAGDAPIRAAQLLARVGLSSRVDHLPAELSGGERQRVAIARALINRPEVVLADEPTGNLDRRTADDVIALLLEIHQELSTVLVVVTHSESIARKMSMHWNLVEGRLES